MGLRERLGKEWLFCDGGTGSILQGLGLKGGELPETWNLTRPDDIKALNKSYFDAGSNIVNTNTFGANRFKFDNVSEIVTAAVKICQQARKEAGREDDAYVAIDVGPTGKLLEPMGQQFNREMGRRFHLFDRRRNPGNYRNSDGHHSDAGRRNT